MNMYISEAIKSLYPDISGVVYWETNQDGSPLNSPEQGISCDKKSDQDTLRADWDAIETKAAELVAAELVIARKSQINTEARRQIIALADEDTQRNFLAEISDIINKSIEDTSYVRTTEEQNKIDNSKIMKSTINGIRDKASGLKTELELMTNEELEAFDATDEANWA